MQSSSVLVVSHIYISIILQENLSNIEVAFTYCNMECCSVILVLSIDVRACLVLLFPCQNILESLSIARFSEEEKVLVLHLLFAVYFKRRYFVRLRLFLGLVRFQLRLRDSSLHLNTLQSLIHVHLGREIPLIFVIIATFKGPLNLHFCVLLMRLLPVANCLLGK